MADFEEQSLNGRNARAGGIRWSGRNEQRPVGVQAASAITRKIGESAS